MSFLRELKEVLENDYNVSYTENGAIGYKTTGSRLLDLNFSVSSLRKLEDCKVVEAYSKAYYDDKVLACQWLFFAGDVRQGMGERRLFRVCYRFVAFSDPDVARKLIPFVAEYTRWDNLFMLIGTPIEKEMLDFVKNQLLIDFENHKQGKNISLLAKWMPSINSKSQTVSAIAKIFCKHLGLSAKEYRKGLATLRTALNLVEKNLTNKSYSKIEYQAVPSKANLLYSKAFLRNDKERRSEFLENLKNGESKINASVLYPYDIIREYRSNERYYIQTLKYREDLEQLWKALPNYARNLENTLCVLDGSGSMMCSIGGTKSTALDVAQSIAIYYAERMVGEFKDTYITFSQSPRLVSFAGKSTLKEKLEVAYSNYEAENTNIQKVFELILDTALKYKMPQSQMPKTLLILSDMEFDFCVVKTSDTYEKVDKNLFEYIKEKYNEHGYKLPKLVFWNINSRSATIPVRQNDLGVALVSGFSPAISQMIFSQELDPLKILLEHINQPRYLKIANAIKENK